MIRYIPLLLIVALGVQPAVAHDSDSHNVSGSVELNAVDTSGSAKFNVSASSSDENSSNWIRDTQPDSTSTSADKDHKGEIDILSGSAIDESTTSESQHNESDLDFVNRLVELGAVYVKFGDIKGESDNSSSDGDPDRPIITGDVPNPEAAKKPKEIVVVGSKVRGWDPETKESIVGTAKPVEEVATLDDVVVVATDALVKSNGFNEIRMDDSSVVLDYQHGLKLFGFISMQMRSEATITFGDGEHGVTDPDEIGRVKVKFPWYHVLGRKTVRPADIMSAYQKGAGEGNDAYIDTFAWAGDEEGILLQKKAQAIQILSNVMKNVHDPGITILE